MDERVRVKKMPDDVFEESLRYILAHEIGHCLGFMHNMAASAAYPIEKLRDPEFTRTHGTTPSIMDYARFNYIAQPEDTKVTLCPPDLGIYDYFLIEWNYRYLSEFRSEWEEKATVENWVDVHAGDPIYRYGRQQTASRYDPSSLEEDLGDDPIRAGEYGIRNLQYILPKLNGWITEDEDYQHRHTLYNQIVNQYYRYVRNVLYNVGGIYLTEVKEGTPGERHAPVPRQIQKESLQWVMNRLREMDWIDEPELKKTCR
ncbi:MAG: zinc-dependent metalloprotease [Rikenellaceae bacterium]|nr:zinc-dependent metalloprotease [Rikenellaceae bacterium]